MEAVDLTLTFTDFLTQAQGGGSATISVSHTAIPQCRWHVVTLTAPCSVP